MIRERKIKKTLILVLVAAILSNSPSFIAYAAPKTEDTPKGGSNKTEKTTPPEEQATTEATLSTMSAEPVFEGSVGKGTLLSPLLSESFQTDLATGAATVNIPIVVPPGRKNMQPNLALSYSSNNPNGVAGVGWALTTSSIQRSTKNGTPKYDATDTFVFASSGSSGELVLINEAPGEKEYRQRIETGFMKYIFDSAASTWTVWDKNGTKYSFGSSSTSNSKLEDSGRVFAWYLDKVEDVYGNYLTYIYEKHTDGQIYLKEINYTGGTGGLLPDKSIILNYIDNRTDKIYNNRSGWEIVTSRLLNSIDVNLGGSREWWYELLYTSSPDTERSLLSEIRVKTLSDTGAEISLPPKKFAYQTVE